MEDLQEWIRRIRGAILSEVFGLENDLVLLELAEEFGTVGAAAPPPGYFEKDQALREEHSLGSKIDRAKSIIRRLWDNKRADQLIQKLATCREVRNLMAHYPSWIEPVNDEERRLTISFKLFIGDRHHVWQLEQSDAVLWQNSFFEARRELIRLKHELIGAPEPDFAEGSLSINPPRSPVD